MRKYRQLFGISFRVVVGIIFSQLAGNIANARKVRTPVAMIVSPASTDTLPDLAWSIRDRAKLAVADEESGRNGAFVGIACNGSADGASHFVFGVAIAPANAALLKVLRRRVGTLIVATQATTLATRFTLAPHNSGAAPLGKPSADFIADLDVPQFAAIASARSIVITTNGQTFRFSGKGSAEAMAHLACPVPGAIAAAMPAHRATGIVPVRPTTGATYAKRAASAASPPVRASAACRNGPRNDRILAAVGTADHRGRAAPPAAAMGMDARSSQVYRDNPSVAAFLIKADGVRNPGHALSGVALNRLMKAQGMNVVRSQMAVDESIREAVRSVADVAKICTAQG